MSDTRQVKISADHKEKLQKLISLSELKFEKEYLETMIDFFFESGLDPSEKIFSTGKELKKTRDTFISFIKEHEKSKLGPIINELKGINKSLIEFFKETAVTKDDLAKFLDVAFSDEIKPDQATADKARDIFNELMSGIKHTQDGFFIDKNLYLSIREKINEL